MSNIKKWCEAILQVDTDKMSIISVRNIQLIKQEFEHLQKENDFLKKDMLESLRVNGEQSKRISELEEGLEAEAITFNNWLAEEGYCFTEVRYKLYYGGKYYWIQDIYKKFIKAKQLLNK